MMDLLAAIGGSGALMYLILLGGAGAAVIRWPRHPRISALVLVATVAMLFAAMVSTIAGYLWRQNPENTWIFTASNIITLLPHCGGLALLVFAAGEGRDTPAGSVAPSRASVRQNRCPAMPAIE